MLFLAAHIKNTGHFSITPFVPYIVFIGLSALIWFLWKYTVKKVFKLTIISFIGPFIATFFIVLFVLLMQFLWKYIDDLVGKGLEWYIIGKLLFFFSATLVPLALPLAVLLSSIMTFGKLAETNELLALKTSGTSLLRVMFPLITVVAGLSIGAFFFANNVIPIANLKAGALLWDVRNQRPALDIKPGIFYKGLDNYVIRVDSKDNMSQNIKGVTIYDHTTNQGNNIVTTAANGAMATTTDKNWLILKLYNGRRDEDMENEKPGTPNTYPHSRMYFKTFETRFDLSGFKLTQSKEDLYKNNFEMLNISQLQYFIDSMTRTMASRRKMVRETVKPYLAFYKDTGYFYHKPVVAGTFKKGTGVLQNISVSNKRNVASRATNNARVLKEILQEQAREIDDADKYQIKCEVEWHRKFAMSFACLTLFFIGAPLGAIIRKGGIGMPTVVSLVMFVIFYVITIIGEKSAKEGAIGSLEGMWLPSIILLPFGLFLTYMANRDAISFSSNAIIRLVKRLWPFGKKKDTLLNPDTDEDTADI